MWSANTTKTASGDNKKNEELEDCSCSGAEEQQKQELQNKFDNSKHQSTQSPSCTLAALKTKELAQELETDSGFISGPQSGYISEKFEDSSKEPTNIGQPLPQIQQKSNNDNEKTVVKSTVFDSGCITEDLTENKESEAATNQTKSSIDIVEQNEQMRFKNNVDSGISERFCTLSLQTGQSGGINNLNTPRRRSASTPIADEYQQFLKQHQQQQTNSSVDTNTAAATAASAVPSATQTTNFTPVNAWEEFFKQNSDGDTPLHLACITGSKDVVAALIRMAVHPCLFNIQNDDGQTPLHLAALAAQPKILRMLLIAGAEPTIRDCRGNTALHLASDSGEEQCVSALTIPISASEIQEAHRQYGHRSTDRKVSYVSSANLPSGMEIRNYDGERCVHLAAQGGHIDILRILHLYGADINAREGKSGRTPLHIAIEACNEDLVNFLLEECQQDLNLETATYAGLTAYQVACILNKSQLQNILQNRGAEPLTPPESDYDSSDIETDLDDSMMFGDPGYFVNYKSGNTMTVV